MTEDRPLAPCSLRGGGKLGQDSLPVRVPKPGSCLPRAPTDPDVPNSGTVADPAVGGW